MGVEDDVDLERVTWLLSLAEARSPLPEMPAEATEKEPGRDRAESSGDIAHKSLRGRLFTKPVLRDTDPEEAVDKNPTLTPAGRL